MRRAAVEIAVLAVIVAYGLGVALCTSLVATEALGLLVGFVVTVPAALLIGWSLVTVGWEVLDGLHRRWRAQDLAASAEAWTFTPSA